MPTTLTQDFLHAKLGDLVHLLGEKDTHFIFTLQQGITFQTHLGMIPHEDIAGQPWGGRVRTHLGNTFIGIDLGR